MFWIRTTTFFTRIDKGILYLTISDDLHFLTREGHLDMFLFKKGKNVNDTQL